MSIYSRIFTYTTHSSFLRRVKSGDEKAWREFYAKYSGMIHYIGQQRRLTAEECDDLMIEVMTVFWQKLDSFVYDPSVGRFRSYLAKFAKLCAMKNFSTRCRYNKLVENITPEYPPDIDAARLEEWRNFLLEKALEELKTMVNTVTFQVFYMSFFQKRPIAEISAITRKSANNIYNIRLRCMRKLRKLIAEYRQFSEAELLRHSHRNKEEN